MNITSSDSVSSEAIADELKEAEPSYTHVKRIPAQDVLNWGLPATDRFIGNRNIFDSSSLTGSGLHLNIFCLHLILELKIQLK